MIITRVRGVASLGMVAGLLALGALAAPAGELRDHRADIKHSLVDPVQLAHMPEVVRASVG